MMDYGVCKAGLLYLTKALAKQYAPHVRVNVVLPGPIWSRMWTRPGGLVDQLVANYGVDKEAAVKRFLQERYMPLGIGQPEDVAQAVVFLGFTAGQPGYRLPGSPAAISEALCKD